MDLLFGGGGGSRSPRPKNLVEFRAGKMTLKGNIVSPDKRKGLVYVYHADDLTHFCWKDRASGAVEDDLILFPDDCEYKKVTQCKEGSRVFLLKFKSSARRLFFWMQEPKTDSDDDYLWKVNDALNNPGGSGSRGNDGSSLSASSSEQAIEALLSSMSEAQLMQLIGGMAEHGGGSGFLAQLNQLGNPSPAAPQSGSPAIDSTSTGNPAPSSTAPVARAPAIKLLDLQKILSPTNTTQGSPNAGVSSELIQRIISNPSMVKKMAPLLQKFSGPPQVDNASGTTPNDQVSSEAKKKKVEDTLSVPQFHSALRAFCTAFPAGQLGPLVSQFDMGKPAVEAAEAGNLEAFVNAIQVEADTQADEPEDMNID